MIIGVDVDLTIIDPIWCEGGWFEHLKENSYSYGAKSLQEDSLAGCVNYNLCEYFDLHENFCPYDFWRKKDLYDNIQPYKEAVEVLKRLYDGGHEIIFISQIKGDHLKSKTNMLKKYFPFAKGFIYTKEKEYVYTDIMIDDRNKVMNKLIFGRGIIFKTEYSQCEPLQECTGVKIENSWEGVYKNIADDWRW